LLILGVPRGKRYPAGALPVEADLEGILPRPGQWDIKHQYSAGFDVDNSGRRLTELHSPFAAEELVTAVIHEADSDRVYPNLGTPAADPENQVGAGVHGRKVREPDMLEHAEHAELALLVDQGVISDNGEVEVQGSGDSD
jgi:hypothetical protein